MGKIKIDKNDKSRILLTELLPYEVPILFSNEGFYNYYRDKGKTNPPSLINKILGLDDNNYKIPYSFDIKKGSDSKRTLSVIHPCIQAKFIDFYQKYDALIIHLCSRSPMSLRYPSKVATHFYYKNDHEPHSTIHEPNVEVVQSGFETELKYSSSYFAYKKYNLLFKFYDSYEFLRLEKKFKHLLRFDISKCFDNIYTHTISWAVKDKTFAKANIKSNSFEVEFDKLMQKSNYNETNGILIGSEISRIFAEIILQKIDLETIEKLKIKGIHFGADYAARRYVDDYFVFTNDEKLSKEILKTFQTELTKFKLSVNESKTERTRAPFISGITIARTELQKILVAYFEKHIQFEEFPSPSTEAAEQKNKARLNINALRCSTNRANWLIRDIKSIVKIYNIEYDSITGLTFSIFKKHLNKFYRICDTTNLGENDSDSIVNFLLVTFDIMFFIYSMDYRVRATYVISQIIIATNRFISACGDSVKHTISKKIFDESIYLIKNIEQEDNHNNVELLNLLISLKDLGTEYLLTSDSLNSLMNIDKDIEKFSYFHFVILLYYMQDTAHFDVIRQKLEKKIIAKIVEEKVPFQKTEHTCLLLDTIRCPFVSRQTKETLVEVSYGKIESTPLTDEKRNRIINYIADRNWFIDWSSGIELDSILLKKELRTPY